MLSYWEVLEGRLSPMDTGTERETGNLVGFGGGLGEDEDRVREQEGEGLEGGHVFCVRAGDVAGFGQSFM